MIPWQGDIIKVVILIMSVNEATLYIWLVFKLFIGCFAFIPNISWITLWLWNLKDREFQHLSADINNQLLTTFSYFIQVCTYLWLVVQGECNFCTRKIGLIRTVKSSHKWANKKIVLSNHWNNCNFKIHLKISFTRGNRVI